MLTLIIIYLSKTPAGHVMTAGEGGCRHRTWHDHLQDEPSGLGVFFRPPSPSLDPPGLSLNGTSNEQ